MADDGSSIRIKVAQYFVNKKHQGLKDNNLAIKTDDLKYLQALPRFSETGQDSETSQAARASEPEAPPLFPVDQQYSQWDQLLKFAHLPDLPPEDDHLPGQVPDHPEQVPDHPDHPDQVPGHPGRAPDTRPRWWPVWPPWYRVAIIGAGVAGLRTAKLLQNLGIPYKIFEASDRAGGRIFTYDFTPKPPRNPAGNHDYYDVGAMRFPNNKANQRTFELFAELGLSDKLIDYVLSKDNNVRYYNGEC